MILNDNIPELAQRINYTKTAIRRSVESGKFSERLAAAIERDLGLAEGTLPRSQRSEVQRILTPQVPAFQALLEELRASTGISEIAKLMETHYECARAICSKRIRPSVLHVRSLLKNTGDQRWSQFDDPEFEYPVENDVTGLGRSVRARRLELGLSLAKVAEAMGVSQGTVSRYETRGQVPSNRIEALAAVLHIAVNGLLAGAAVAKPSKAA